MASINGFDVRRRLGKKVYKEPIEFGPDGWMLFRLDRKGQVIVTASHAPDDEDETGDVWLHASISRTDRMPNYKELTELHAAVWPDGYAYQVFAPPAAHINIHPRALHLWGREDGAIQLPDFGVKGTI
jgi:hypothetical protein